MNDLAIPKSNDQLQEVHVVLREIDHDPLSYKFQQIERCKGDIM